MTPTKMLASVVTIFVLFMFLLSAYTINEGESALVFRLGKIVGTSSAGTSPLLKPGLHFKVPLLDHVRIFDTRLQELLTSPANPLVVVTKEQTYLVVEYFAKWKISNLNSYFTSTGGDVSSAEKLLEPRINDIVRAEYGKYTSDAAISSSRAKMVDRIRQLASQIGKEQGIDVIDVRIQQITLPQAVMDSVFKRMATERKQFAEGKRAEGSQKSEEIKALADQEVTVIKAKALMEAANERALGDKEAAEIYSKVYGTNPKFYEFYRSLEAYEKSFNQKKDVLVLKPDGQFFNYFRNANGGNNGASASKK